MNSRMKHALLLIFALTAPAAAAEPPRADAYGDPLPPGALLRLGTQRWRANSTLTLAAFRPDGKTLLTVDVGQLAQVWELATGKELRRFEVVAPAQPALASGRGPVSGRGFPGGINAALSGDGKVLACGGRDGVIRTWDVDTGKELNRFDGGRNSNSRLALSHDGKRLAAATIGSTITIWDTASGAQKHLGNAAEDPVLGGGPGVRMSPSFRTEFGPDGKTLLQVALDASNARNPVIIIWDLESGKERHRFGNFGDLGSFISVMRCAVSPDHKFVAMPFSGDVVLIDLTTGKEARRLKGLPAPDILTGALTFSPDGKQLAGLTGRNENLTIWDVQTGNVLRQFGKPAAAPAPGPPPGRGRTTSSSSLSFSTDGSTLACVDGPAVLLIDVMTGKLRNDAHGHLSPLREALFSASGREVWTHAVDGTVMRWDSATGRRLGKLESLGRSPDAGLSPDGKWVAITNAVNSVSVFDAATGKESYSINLPALGTFVNYISAEFSPDSRTLAVTDPNGQTISLYDAASGKQRSELRLPELSNTDPDGGGFGGVRFRSGALRPIFSADGRMLAVYFDNKMLLYNLSLGGPGRDLHLPTDQPVRCAVLAPDGYSMAIEFADGEIALWEIASGTRRATLCVAGEATFDNTPQLRFAMRGYGMNIGARSLAFSPD